MEDLSTLSHDELWKLNTALKIALICILISKPDKSCLSVIASGEVKELVDCIEEIEKRLGIRENHNRFYEE